jgi:hypothetical protein
MSKLKLYNTFDEKGDHIDFDIEIESFVRYKDSPADSLDELRRQRTEINFAIATKKYLNNHKDELLTKILNEVE